MLYNNGGGGSSGGRDLNYYPDTLSSFWKLLQLMCNCSHEDRVPADEIYQLVDEISWYPLFKWVAVIWLNDSVPIYAV